MKYDKDINKVDELDILFLDKYLDNADEPFQFISVYKAIKDIVINKNNDINIPILFDASCSGIQHLSSLCNDINIAEMVNVVSTENCKNDFYQIAADYVIKYINDMPYFENNDIKNNLMKIKINRSILKIPIMTISYNVGLEKMSKELLNKMGKIITINNIVITENDSKIDSILDKEKNNKLFKIKINKEYSMNNEDLILTPKEWGIFATIIYKSVYEIGPSLREFNYYLNNFMSFIGKRNLPLIWVTPSGMKIKFAVGKSIKKRAGLGFIRKGSGTQINIINKNEVDVKKSVTALMPNFIHSLDASNIHLITDYLLSLEIDKTIEYFNTIEKEVNKNFSKQILYDNFNPYIYDRYKPEHLL